MRRAILIALSAVVLALALYGCADAKKEDVSAKADTSLSAQAGEAASTDAASEEASATDKGKENENSSELTTVEPEPYSKDPYETDLVTLN